jgi:hypothetical protein
MGIMCNLGIMGLFTQNTHITQNTQNTHITQNTQNTHLKAPKGLAFYLSFHLV